MTLKKKVKKVLSYDFGTSFVTSLGLYKDAIGPAASLAGLLGDSIKNDHKVTVGSALGGSAKGAAAGAAIGSVIPGIGTVAGAIGGGLIGLVSGTMGSSGSVDSSTGEVEYASGLKGLFGGHSRSYLNNLGMQVRKGNFANLATALMLNDYSKNHSRNLFTMAAYGGILPTTLAYIDDGEMLRLPNGLIYNEPEEGKPTDSNLREVPVGSEVFSDKLKVPGTNKTFAQVGKKLAGYSKGGKVMDRFAEASQMLNLRNKDIALDLLLLLLEAVKGRTGKKLKRGIPRYGDGNLKTYAYDPIAQFKYWDNEKNEYKLEYRDFVNSLTQQLLLNILEGNYGSMDRFKNAGNNNLSLDEAKRLGLDERYSDWHKMFANMLDALKGMEIVKNEDAKNKPNYANTVIEQPNTYTPKTPSVSFAITDDPNKVYKTIDNVNYLPKIPLNQHLKNLSNDSFGSNWSSYAGPLADIFAPKPKTERPIISRPIYGQTNYNITPQIRQAGLALSIANRNIATRNSSAGAGLAGGIQGALARNNAVADAYSTKYNQETENINKNAEIYNKWREQYDKARDVAADRNAQNLAAWRNIRRQGWNDLFDAIQGNQKDARQFNMDRALLPMYQQYLSNGTDSNTVNNLINGLSNAQGNNSWLSMFKFGGK